jgi:PAS domain S-box-containing protein
MTAGKPLHILIVEDSEDDGLLLLRELQRGGYDPVWERVETSGAMLEALERRPWDIVISDYVLPQFSGLSALKILKQSGLDLPFIILSGNIGESIAVDAMKAGAHDYILKDNFTRLVPAVERELREATVRRERKKAEEALVESEIRYRSLFENSLDAVLLSSADGSILDVNPAACSILNMTKDEILAAGREGIVDMEDPRVSALLEERARTGRARGEITCMRKGGAKFPCDLSSIMFTDKHGIARASTIARDVTERKQTEEKISRMNRLYYVLSKVNEAIVRIHEPEVLYTQVCRIAVEDCFFKMAWIGIADPVTREVMPVSSWGDTHGYLDTIKVIAADRPEGSGPTGRTVFTGRYHICSDIEYDPIMLPWRERALKNGFRSSASFPLRNGYEVIGALTVYSSTPQFFTDEEIGLMSSLSEDISLAIDSMFNEKRRLEAEQALLKSAEEIEDLYNNAPCGYHSLDKDGTVVRINDTELKWLGYSREEVVGKMKLTDLMPVRSSEAFGKNFQVLKERGWMNDLELDLVRKDGTILPVLLNATVVRDKNGNFVMCRSTLYDMTDRKRSERHIKATNELLKLFSQTFMKKEYLDELVVMLREWSGCAFAGIRLVEESGDIPFSAVSGLSREFMEQERCHSLRKDSCVCTRIITGKPEPSETSFMTPGGSFVCNDVSLLRPEIRKGRQPRNRGTCLEQSFSSLSVVPIRYRDKVLGAIHLADRKGKNFHSYTIEFLESISPLIGEALYRFFVEESLVASREQLRNLSAHLQATREEERIKVAREIHDELGQSLTAASLELSRIKGKEQLSGAAAGYIKSAAGLIDAAVQDIQRICSELRPRILDHLGLKAAVEWQAENFFRRAGINFTLQLDDGLKKLPDNVSTVMFRIFQEALTNISRHSGATKVSVYIMKEDNTLVLRVTDNGKGITKQQLSGEKSFGILGIHERAHELGGEVTFSGLRNKGTTITVKIPLNTGGNNV